jgi:hypothetical protein
VCIVLPTYACRPRILLAFSSGLRCSMLKDAVEFGKVLIC